MLTSLSIKNFKRFEDVTIPLGDPVVFIGPNNSGKTTALQALTLFSIGLSKWIEKRGLNSSVQKRTGVTINRRDLLAVPIPEATLLWRDLHVRSSELTEGKQKTTNIKIEIILEGITDNEPWTCGLEFDYANPESLYCRPIKDKEGRLLSISQNLKSFSIAFLPPMSGLAAQEIKLETGAINVKIGEGRTAEVLRNLCYQISSSGNDEPWKTVVQNIRDLFGVILHTPEYIIERGEITMEYDEIGSGITLDISSAGRGLHQTLLLLAYLYSHPGDVLLLDEPDAHLEILRQRQIFNLLIQSSQKTKSQIIAASHSEVVLNEAADKNVVVAFIGKPHRIDKKVGLEKSLREYGYDQYYLAERRDWVLYVEGSTDLAILQEFAKILNHKSLPYLTAPFIRYIGCNEPSEAQKHYYAMKEANKNLRGIALFDRLNKEIKKDPNLTIISWKKREIENYFAIPEVIVRFLENKPDPATQQMVNMMKECLTDAIPPRAMRDRKDRWWTETKMSDDFLDPLWADFFERSGQKVLINKGGYYEIAQYLYPDEIDPEIIEKLDKIYDIAVKTVD
ncbi:AAA family ATPase [Methanospirillum stamsii]|uniref:AAA family ATPase n=2 Tax=Methanospirillum stamsii TaxID=1277351 RepID=A0A2V2N618_9EURY|nr:AAA family ATPase [Methanospirillum stamsii]